MFREKLIELLQKSGYDVFTACEYASATMQEIKLLRPGVYTWIVGNYTLQFCKSVTLGNSATN